jgi:hypothetical protein
VSIIGSQIRNWNIGKQHDYILHLLNFVMQYNPDHFPY